MLFRHNKDAMQNDHLPGDRSRVASFETERLRVFTASDSLVDAVFDYRLRSAEYHAPWEKKRPPGFWSKESIVLRLATAAQDAVFDRGYTYYFSLKTQPDSIIGSLSLSTVIRGALQNAQLGYGISPEVAGQGYMTEAVSALTAVAFSQLNLHRLEANIMPVNKRSIAVIESCSFANEGLQKHYLLINDVWEDHLRFSKVNEGWSMPTDW